MKTTKVARAHHGAPAAAEQTYRGGNRALQRWVDDSPRQSTQQAKVAQWQGDGGGRSGKGLPPQFRSGVETLSGLDMSDVVVHRNSAKPAQLNALAYAQGNEIHLGPGQERHLPHEAWHLVQQAQGRVKPTLQMQGGLPINNDEGLEREADAMGAKALQLVMSPTRARAQRGQTANGGSSGDVAQCVLTRSMVKTINETVFRDDDDADRENMRKFLKNRNVDDSDVGQIIEWIKANGKNQGADILTAYPNFRAPGIDAQPLNDDDEEAMNIADHGDLEDYENTAHIEQTLKTYRIENSVASARSLSAAAAAATTTTTGGGDPMQMARKGGTVSGPKSYGTPTAGDFKKVSYTLGRRGEIDFSMGTSAEPNGWKNPVATNSLVNLNDAKVQIKKGDRSQHFALGDKLYAEKNNLGKASDTTEMRRKKLTWHHLATKHNMVLVDMQVHRKHGHNGGVHLW